jgi:hypothetical protein
MDRYLGLKVAGLHFNHRGFHLLNRRNDAGGKYV